jgi:hypothetical protein
MGYKILGYAVWNGGKLYVRRKYGGGTARKAAAFGVVGVAVAVLVARGARSGSSA